jgi:pimeloyl-ACP methyl ester carboxylesterase
MVQRTLVRDDVSLAVTDWGGDGPPMVLIHGLTGTQHAWDGVVAELAPRFRVVTYDQRGHGESSRSVTYAWESLVDDLEAIVRDLELRDVTLVGLSTGAGVALGVASRIDCRALAMVDGAFTVAEPAPPRPLSRMVYWAVRHRFHRGPHMSRIDVGRVGDAYRSRSPQFEASLRALACPALYLLGTQLESGVQGAGFQAAREDTAVRSVQLSPRVRVQWIEAQHDMVETHPRAVANAVVALYERAHGEQPSA